MPLIAYTDNIPVAGNNPSVDQPSMTINTNAIDTIIGIDHFSFNNNSGGSHKQVTLTNESAPGLGDGNGVLYANLQNSQSWPFWQNALGSFQMMGAQSIVAKGYATLPGGLIIQWGPLSGMVSGTNNASFGIAFPTTVFAILLQPIRISTSNADTLYVKTGSVTLSTFQIVNTSSSIPTGYFFAVGN